MPDRLFEFCPGCGYPAGRAVPLKYAFCGLEGGCGMAGGLHGTGTTHPDWHGRLGTMNAGCTCDVCTAWAAEHDVGPYGVPIAAA